MGSQADRHASRQMGSQADRHASRLTHRHADTQTCRQTDRKTDRQTDRPAILILLILFSPNINHYWLSSPIYPNVTYKLYLHNTSSNSYISSDPNNPTNPFEPVSPLPTNPYPINSNSLINLMSLIIIITRSAQIILLTL
jgi:hypothetical protein